MASRTMAPTTEDAKHALQVAQTIQELYLDAEDSLFQSLADHLWRAADRTARTDGRRARLQRMRERLDAGGMTDRQRREMLADLPALAAGGSDERMVREYLERRSTEIKALRREATRIIARLERRAFPAVVEAVTAAWRRGVTSAIDDIDNLGGKQGIPAGQGVVELARQIVRNLRRRHVSALRTIDDEFQEVNRSFVGRALTGAETIDQVVERELKDYARRGVTRFVDRAGKTWDLPTYAEMTTRTSVIRAGTDGHIATLRASGHQYVIVNQDLVSCPRCAPYDGGILAIDDDAEVGMVEVTNFLSDEPMTIEVLATVEGARRRGFQHPNCGHTTSLYTPGVTSLPPRPPSRATYEDAQLQRRLERELRAAKRLAAVARTPARQREARDKAKRLGAELDELAETKGLPRRRRQERVRGLSAEGVAEARQARIAAGRARRVAADARRRGAEARTAQEQAVRERRNRLPRSTGGAPMDGGPDGSGAAPGGGAPEGGGPAGPRGGPGPSSPPSDARAQQIAQARQELAEVQSRQSRPVADAPPPVSDEEVRQPEPEPQRTQAQQQAREAAEQAQTRTRQRPTPPPPSGEDSQARSPGQQAARDALNQDRTREQTAELAQPAEPEPQPQSPGWGDAEQAMEETRARREAEREATPEPAGDEARDAEQQQEQNAEQAPARKAQPSTARARDRRGAQPAEPTTGLWTRDLQDPADRPSWFTQGELDDRQLIAEPDGSSVVVVAGEILGRVRQSQARPGRWFAQHPDRTEVSRRAGTQEEMINRLIAQAGERWQAKHPDPDQPAGDADQALRDAQSRYDSARAEQDELARHVQELSEQLEDPDADPDTDELEEELQEAEAELSRRSQAVAEAAEQVRQARATRERHGNAHTPVRAGRRDFDPVQARREDREMRAHMRNIREAQAELQDAEARLERIQDEADIARRLQTRDRAEVERDLVRTQRYVEQVRQRARETAAAMRETRDAMYRRRVGPAPVIPQLERIREEAPIRAEFAARQRAEEARLREQQQDARQAMAARREQAEKVAAEAARRVREEEARLQRVADAERERLREQGITGVAARAAVRDAVLPARGPLADAEEAERAARRAVAALGQEQDALERRQQQEERQLRASRDREMRAALEQRSPRLDQPVKETRPLGGGDSARTELVTLEDGTQAVRKTARTDVGDVQDSASEEAVSWVASALGLRAPRVYRRDADSVLMEYIADGVTAEEGRSGDQRFADAPASDDGAVMGLLDLLVNNVDRNDGNWMLDSSGRLVAIDHGVAYGETVGVGKEPSLGPHSPFTARFKDLDSDEPRANPLTDEDVSEVRRRLERLRPEFERIDRGHWLDYSLRMLDLLGQHASGTRNLIAGVRRAGARAAPRARRGRDMAAEEEARLDRADDRFDYDNKWEQ